MLMVDGGDHGDNSEDEVVDGGGDDGESAVIQGDIVVI